MLGEKKGYEHTEIHMKNMFYEQLNKINYDSF